VSSLLGWAHYRKVEMWRNGIPWTRKLLTSIFESRQEARTATTKNAWRLDPAQKDIFDNHRTRMTLQHRSAQSVFHRPQRIQQHNQSSTTTSEPYETTKISLTTMATEETTEQPLDIQPTKRKVVRLTMLGCVWNANYVLEQALKPETKSINQELFENCKGIVLLTMAKAGVFVTGHVGTGVMMAKDPETGAWSPPVAQHIAGYGFGAALGKKDEDVLIFIMDDASMKDFAHRPQTRIGVTAALNVGKTGCEVEKGMNTTFEGKDTIMVRYTKGAFTGATLEMGTLDTAQDSQNHKFYGKKVTVKDVLFKKDSVTLPKDSLIPDIHDKLGMLARGETWVPGDVDRSRSGRHYQIAKEAEKEAKKEGK